MIAIITSTIFPSEKPIFGDGGDASYACELFPNDTIIKKANRSSFTHNERLLQTKATIKHLKEHGINDIYLIDNSSKEYHAEIRSSFELVNVITSDAYQFVNKGISEALLILYCLKYLPPDQEILKLSGRYYLNNNFIKPDKMNYDYIVRGYNYYKKRGLISTRCYMVRNKEILEKVTLKVINKMYTRQDEVTGPRSFAKYLKRKIFPETQIETTISIELATAIILKESTMKVKLLNTIGLEGYAGATKSKTFISE